MNHHHQATAELKALAQDRIDEIVQRLAPGGKYNRTGRPHYLVSNPMRRDTTPSLCVWTRGTAAGGFMDFGERDEVKGDVFGLVAYLNGRPIKDFAFARAWLQDFLGIAAMTSAEKEAAAESRARRKAENAEADERRRRFNQRRALNLHHTARLILPGTPAWTYLADVRGIRLDQVPHYSGELRYLRSYEWWMGAEWGERIEGGRRQRYKIRPGPSFPCIITPLRDRAGSLRALHYTFLAPDGSGKAPVDKPKLIFPEQAGLSMWIAHGPSGLDPCEADIAGRVDPLALGEGLEDGLSIALSVPELRVWGAVSLGNLAVQPVDRPCVSELYVAAQNDWGKPAALKQLARAEEALARHGKPMARLPAFTGKDVNDTLLGKE